MQHLDMTSERLEQSQQSNFDLRRNRLRVSSVRDPLIQPPTSFELTRGDVAQAFEDFVDLGVGFGREILRA